MKIRFSTHSIHFTKYFEKGRERKWIKRIVDELEKESLGFEELGAKVKPKLGLLKTRGKGDGFFSSIKS